MNAWLLLVANALGRLGDHESQRMDMGMDMDMGVDSAAGSALDSALDSYPPVALPDLSAASPPAPPAGAAAAPAAPKKRAGGVDASTLGELVSLKNFVGLKSQELAAVDTRASVRAESVPHMDTAAAHLDAAKARMDPAVHAQALAHMTAALAHVDAAKAQMAAAHAGSKAAGAGQGAAVLANAVLLRDRAGDKSPLAVAADELVDFREQQQAQRNAVGGGQGVEQGKVVVEEGVEQGRRKAAGKAAGTATDEARVEQGHAVEEVAESKGSASAGNVKGAAAALKQGDVQKALPSVVSFRAVGKSGAVKDAGSSSQHLTAGAGRAAAGGRATGSATLKRRLDALVAGMTRGAHKSSKSVRTGATQGVRLNTTPDEYNRAIADTQNSVNNAVHDAIGEDAAQNHPLHATKADIDNLIVSLNRLLGHNDTATTGTPPPASPSPSCFSPTPEPVQVVVQGYQLTVPVHTAGEAVAPQDVADYTDAFSRHLTLQWANQVKLQLEAVYRKLTTQEGLEDPTVTSR